MDYSDYTEIEWRVKRKYRRKGRKVWMFNHTLIFVAVNGAIWLNYLSFVGQADFQLNVLIDRVIVSVAWLILLIMHYVNYRMGETLDREVEREIERERRLRLQLGYDDEKPKHENDGYAPLTSLIDDGEFAPNVQADEDN